MKKKKQNRKRKNEELNKNIRSNNICEKEITSDNFKKIPIPNKKTRYMTVLVLLSIILTLICTFLFYHLDTTSAGEFKDKDIKSNEKIVKALYSNGLKNDIKGTFSYTRIDFKDDCYDIEEIYNEGFSRLEYFVEDLVLDNGFLKVEINGDKICFYDTFNHSQYQDVKIVRLGNSIQLTSTLKPQLIPLAMIFIIIFLLSFSLLFSYAKEKKLA